MCRQFVICPSEIRLCIATFHYETDPAPLGYIPTSLIHFESEITAHLSSQSFESYDKHKSAWVFIPSIFHCVLTTVFLRFEDFLDSCTVSKISFLYFKDCRSILSLMKS